MSDLIRREDIVEVLYQAIRTTLTGTFTDSMSLAIAMANNLPSAEPERKKGYWIPVTNGRGGFECDQCHNYAPSYQNGDKYLSYFCPNCGADMRGE